jgi:hypothetical protein
MEKVEMRREMRRIEDLGREERKESDNLTIE